jgi:hypothetical protein
MKKPGAGVDAEFSEPLTLQQTNICQQTFRDSHPTKTPTNLEQNGLRSRLSPQQLPISTQGNSRKIWLIHRIDRDTCRLIERQLP